MLLEHRGQRPQIHESACIAPTAVVCGDVRIGRDSCILFGAVLVAQGGPITIGSSCIVMENAVLRGTSRQAAHIGDHVLIGPRAYLTGCVVEENCFLATGTTIFNGATIGARSEVRINGVVHLQTRLPEDSTVPIGWVAVGHPAEILPPKDHEKIWSIQEPLNFPRQIFGLERPPSGETIMPELTRRYTKFLSQHKMDRVLSDEDHE